MDLILVVDDELSMFARHREQVDPDIAILRPERQTPWIQTRARAHTHTPVDALAGGEHLLFRFNLPLESLMKLEPLGDRAKRLAHLGSIYRMSRLRSELWGQE